MADGAGAAVPEAEAPPLVAQPRDAVDDASSSAALPLDGRAVLDQLLAAHKIEPDKAGRLRAAYDKLHSTVQLGQEREHELLNRAKELSQTVQMKQSQAERQADFLLEDASEVGDLRRELWNHLNELKIVKERDEDLQRVQERLKVEHDELEKEIKAVESRKPGAVDPEVVQIKLDIQQLGYDLDARKQEVAELRGDYDERAKLVAAARDESQRVEEDITETQRQLQVESMLPQRIAKQAEHQFAHAIKSLSAQKREAVALHDRLAADIAAHEAQHAEVAHKLSEYSFSVEKSTHAKEMSQRKMEQISLDLKKKREDRKTMLGDNLRLTNEIKLRVKEEKLGEDQITRLGRFKDSGLRKLRAIENKSAALRNANETEHAKRSSLNAVLHAKKQEQSDLRKAMEQAGTDKEALERRWTAGVNTTEEEKRHVRDLKAKLEQLVKEAALKQQESYALSRDLRSKQHSVDQAVAEAMRANAAAERAEGEVASKEVQVKDSEKSIDAIKKTLKELELVYQVVKNEKNKFLTQISNSHQRQTEMKEKVRILANETEILRTSVLEKDAKIQLQVTRLNGEHREKEKFLNDETQLKLKKSAIEAECRSIALTLKKQEEMVANQTEAKRKLGTRFDKAVQEKNNLGKQLLDRHEELQMYWEKLHIFEKMIRTGDLKSQERDDELRHLRLQKQELQRAIQLARGQLPNKKKAEDELVATRTQLLETQTKVRQLEKLLESPTSSRQWRYLEGAEPSQLELDQKTEALAGRLAQKEEVGLERDMVLEETSRLVRRSEEQVEEGRADTLQLARTMNEYQAKIKDVTRKLKANLSELSMYHANCIKHEQELLSLEQTLKDGGVRFELGEAPTEEAAEEWARIERKLEQESAVKEMQRLGIAVEHEDYGARALGGGGRTFAELRPNAYIPEGQNALPVPKPYGRDAPFRPSDPSAQLRHLRGRPQLETAT